MLLRRLEELHGAPVVHRLLAGAPAPWPCPGGEDHRVAALHGFSDATFDPLFLEVNQHGLCAVGFDVGHLLLLADQPPHLVPVLGEHPYQPPRRLAVRPRYENLHSRSPYSPSQRLPSLSRCETGTGTLLYLVHARNDAASGAAAPQPRTFSDYYLNVTLPEHPGRRDLAEQARPVMEEVALLAAHRVRRREAGPEA